MYSIEQKHALQYTIWGEKALEYIKNIQFWTKAYFGIYVMTQLNVQGLRAFARK